MDSKRSLRQFMVLGAAIAGIQVGSVDAFAQTPAVATQGVPGISCYLPPLKLSDADVTSFLGRPQDDLASFEGAGLPLSTRVRTLAASDVRTLAPILARVRMLSGTVAPNAPVVTPPAGPASAAPTTTTPNGAGADGSQANGTPATSPAPSLGGPAGSTPPPAYLSNAQITAIAEGLAAASVSCSRVGNELGTIIQEEVVKTGDEAFMQAFVKALELQNAQQIETAALGPGGAAASSPASAIGNDGQAGSNSGPFGDESVPTTSGDFSFSTDQTLYFSDNGSGGSDEQQVSPTQP